LEEVDVVPFARLPGDRNPCDVLVVDEAQDLINYENLGRLDDLVRGGLANGRWAFFLDPNNQIGLIGEYDPEAHEYLRSVRPAEFVLLDNCRNTRQIVQSTQKLTHADVGVSSAGTGPEVVVEFGDDASVQAVRAGTYLDRLEQEGVAAAEVTLLSPKPFPESTWAHLPVRWRRRVDLLDLRSVSERPRSRLGFARISDFKGLESPFVLLGDIVTGRDVALSDLYVGMTRARVGLWLTMPSELEGQVP
jgi:hypothetical protein